MKRKRLRTFLRVAFHLVILRPLLKLYCGVRVTGSEHLHELSRFILIANHNSHLDILLLFSLLPVRGIALTHPVAEETYFERSRIVFGLIRFLFEPLWIQRGHPDRGEGPLRRIKDRLDQGHNIIVFPEGTRGRPGELLAFKSGLGRLVQQYPDIPIVPVFLSGPERILPKACMIPVPFWNHVLVGPPQSCAGSHRDITQHLQNTLQELAQSGVAQRRPRKRQRPPPVPAIAILGIDGSGKSTVSRLITQHLSTDNKTCLVSDRLEFYEKGELKPLQPLGLDAVRGIVSRYAKNARSLATYKIPKLTELLLRDRLLGEVTRWYAPRFIVQDGSPLLNMAAWAALYRMDTIDDQILATAISVLAGEQRGLRRANPVFQQLPELRHLDRLGLTHLRLPQVLVLLDLPPSIACQRIAARGEVRQPHENEERLGKLREAYLRVVQIISRNGRLPTLIVDGTTSLEQAAGESLRFVRKTLNLETCRSHEPSH